MVPCPQLRAYFRFLSAVPPDGLLRSSAFAISPGCKQPGRRYSFRWPVGSGSPSAFLEEDWVVGRVVRHQAVALALTKLRAVVQCPIYGALRMLSYFASIKRQSAS